jgi:hypothetical protein
MENDLSSQYVARSVVQEWIMNAGRERVHLERSPRSLSTLVRDVRRIFISR